MLEFNVTDFEFAHGKKPRGVGNWAFASSRDAHPDHIFFHNGSYSEAKQAARNHFPNLPVIYVLS